MSKEKTTLMGLAIAGAAWAITPQQATPQSANTDEFAHLTQYTDQTSAADQTLEDRVSHLEQGQKAHQEQMNQIQQSLNGITSMLTTMVEERQLGIGGADPNQTDSTMEVRVSTLEQRQKRQQEQLDHIQQSLDGITALLTTRTEKQQLGIGGADRNQPELLSSAGPSNTSELTNRIILTGAKEEPVATPTYVLVHDTFAGNGGARRTDAGNRANVVVNSTGNNRITVDAIPRNGHMNDPIVNLYVTNNGAVETSAPPKPRPVARTTTRNSPVEAPAYPANVTPVPVNPWYESARMNSQCYGAPRNQTKSNHMVTLAGGILGAVEAEENGKNPFRGATIGYIFNQIIERRFTETLMRSMEMSNKTSSLMDSLRPTVPRGRRRNNKKAQQIRLAQMRGFLVGIALAGAALVLSDPLHNSN